MRIIRDNRESLAAAAVGYALSGQRVLPCEPGGKEPLITKWPERATSDVAVVQRWWRRWPEANIGLLTGAPGHDVLDIDVRDDGNGFDVLALLRDAGLLDGSVQVVRTPSGGEHWYFPGTNQRNSKLSGRHVDFQADGGFVLAPPSFVSNEEVNGRYVALARSSPGQPLDWQAVKRLVDPPEAARGSTRRDGPSVSGGPRRYLRAAVPGERNSRLFRAACWMLRKGRDPGVLVTDAIALGLPRDEAERTVASAIRTVGRGR